ncbi:PREDICTED: poly(A)-specific ribonuclease PARN-like domain-containing protein 1 [Condylura cristata]|uniref:poly(A)-specific ribonuclease PARN-like domain-containing protein 1 n=1 Tax=Condylura cristata TaxID=143302 RepID=UPI00033465DF|nr:PREDICTED: poly(A)-specific ribonuclease PARN-like domain-containing protein 1 [Condylura cristata]
MEELGAGSTGAEVLTCKRAQVSANPRGLPEVDASKARSLIKEGERDLPSPREVKHVLQGRSGAPWAPRRRRLSCLLAGLDIEFTGLRSHVSQPQQISLFDLPSEWYLKTRHSIQQFTICQIGLSVFSSIEGETNKYVAHSCNFFLFPTTFGTLDSEFSFQASSVQFLNQYGFDYNKFLKKGIPYMNEEQERKMKQSILTGNWRGRSSLDKDQIKVVIDEVTRWLDLAEEGDWMTLPGVSGFQAFEVQLVLRQALPEIWTVLKDKGVVVKKVSRQHRWYLEHASCDRESCWKEKILLSARGFSVFFQMLVKAQKGVAVSLGLLESYDEFKLNIHNLFPVLIDTKNVTKDVWKDLNFPRVSSLTEVYEVLNSNLNPTKNSGPEIIHASKCEKYVETKYPHEAAYDAFLCGSVLLKVAHLLLSGVHSSVSIPELSFPLYLSVLAPYVNQVNLIRAGVPKINFSGPDSPSTRPPVLILSVRRWPGVSEQLVYREFQNLCKFDVRRLTRSQFLLLTNKFKDARSALREYRRHPTLRLCPFRYWQHCPNVSCLLQVCGVVTTWALVTFLLGRPRP